MVIAQGSCELLVIGGGPAGMGAAIEAARLGVKTLLVDEASSPGGQLYKQIHKFFGSAEHYSGIRGFRIGEELQREAVAAGVEIQCGCRASGVLRDGRVLLSLPGRAVAFRAGRIVLATGGRENSLPFPGWTLPGVMSAGAAQTLCNIHRVLPGRRVMMVGSGNVGLIVAYQLIQAGAEVSGIVEIEQKTGGYYVHAEKLRRLGVPFYTGYQVTEASGDGTLEKVRIAPVGGGKAMSFSVDGLFLSVGLTPNSGLASMFGCLMTYEPLFGGFFPLHDKRMRSSVDFLYVAGDAAGIEEANSSLDEGRLAGISVAEDLGKLSREEAAETAEMVRQRLEGLRSGIHGRPRLLAKRRMTASGNEKPLPAIEVQSSESAALTVLESSLKLGRPLPFIDCPESIPCNPCVTSCSAGAISMEGICGLPVFTSKSCTGCMNCLPACPGQAIIIFGPEKENNDGSFVRVSLPWEQLPLFGKGDRVTVTDRNGEPLGNGVVVAFRRTGKDDGTSILTVKTAKEKAHLIRSVQKASRERG
jgi:thioredoxin reductase/Fe-S-cluster-containing hydrogenase component 2